ncbi:hypothetical protein B0H19DRAFT_78251 [Mycena capillaripes]|nr:hypothetical protein B0H19DRAFT_78251 [Mycena capillaripes]
MILISNTYAARPSYVFNVLIFRLVATSPTMVSDPTSPPGFGIVQVSGPLILAHFLHWGLFSVLTVQLYLYYQAFPNDRLFTKCLVYTIYAIAIVQTVLLTHDGFAAFGYGFEDFAALTAVRFYWFTSPVVGGLVAFMGQSFYAYRVHVLSSGSWTIPVLIVTISLASSVSALISGVLLSKLTDITQVNLNRTISVTTGVSLSTSALCDIIIAVCMTYYLSKTDPQVKQTRVLVSKLVRLILETGSVTAVAALMVVTLWFAFPGSAYYTVFGLPMTTLYGNTTLVVLNARFQIVGSRGTFLSASDTLSAVPVQFQYPGTNGTTTAHAECSPVVIIQRDAFSRESASDHLEMKTIGVRSLFCSFNRE